MVSILSPSRSQSVSQWAVSYGRAKSDSATVVASLGEALATSRKTPSAEQRPLRNLDEPCKAMDVQVCLFACVLEEVFPTTDKKTHPVGNLAYR